jgi:hypothetical protein
MIWSSYLSVCFKHKFRVTGKFFFCTSSLQRRMEKRRILLVLIMQFFRIFTCVTMDCDHGWGRSWISMTSFWTCYCWLYSNSLNSHLFQTVLPFISPRCHVVMLKAAICHEFLFVLVWPWMRRQPKAASHFSNCQFVMFLSIFWYYGSAWLASSICHVPVYIFIWPLYEIDLTFF